MKKRMRRSSQLQCSLLQQCSRVVIVGLGYRVLYYLVKEEEEEEIEEDLAVVCSPGHETLEIVPQSIIKRRW